MDSLDQILSVLASLAAVFGTVISYLQYRVRRQPDGASPTRYAPPPGGGPPSVVRVAASWVVVESVITVLLLYVVFTTVMADIHSLGFTVPDLPEPVVALAPIGLAALIGVVSVRSRSSGPAACATGTRPCGPSSSASPRGTCSPASRSRSARRRSPTTCPSRCSA